MLAEHIRVDVLLIDRIVLRQSGPQPYRIQNRSGADNLIFRKSGNLVKYICENIHRIAYDNISGIRRIFGNLRNDAFGNIDICLRQVQSRLTRLAWNSGGNNDNIGILRIL